MYRWPVSLCSRTPTCPPTFARVLKSGTRLRAVRGVQEGSESDLLAGACPYNFNHATVSSCDVELAVFLAHRLPVLMDSEELSVNYDDIKVSHFPA
eukprot:654649-Hanusia_phi.AAC.1